MNRYLGALFIYKISLNFFRKEIVLFSSFVKKKHDLFRSNLSCLTFSKIFEHENLQNLLPLCPFIDNSSITFVGSLSIAHWLQFCSFDEVSVELNSTAVMLQVFIMITAFREITNMLCHVGLTTLLSNGVIRHKPIVANDVIDASDVCETENRFLKTFSKERFKTFWYGECWIFHVRSTNYRYLKVIFWVFILYMPFEPYDYNLSFHFSCRLVCLVNGYIWI